ncbi:MAG: DUF5685 family protein [Oscillospiraceae bacterium]|nr:DUF5685 family protein [Oscillospiraceae bacterium]
MFGYVRIHKPSLTCGDFALYRGVYCSLCRALGRRYGPLGRLALTYDMTFFALLALSSREDCPGFRKGHCSINPAKRCLKLECCAELDRAADVSLLLARAKWQDNMADSGLPGKLAWALPGIFFSLAGRRAAKRAPQAAKLIRTAMAAQRLVEQDPPGLDSCAHPSAHGLGQLCALANSGFYRLGYLLGRWVYLVDAADDYDKDKKRKRFNALRAAGRDPREAEELLAATAGELAEEWRALCGAGNFVHFRSILENILLPGLEQMERSVTQKGEGYEKSI